jgi:acyl-CoA thioesterase
MPDALFARDGDHFLPSELATSAWGPNVLHGGPVAALVARAAEQALPDPALQPARLTVDLFRAVPRSPLTTSAELIREGRRIVVARVSVLSDDVEVTRGQILFLRPTESATTHPIDPPPGPDNLPTRIGVREAPLSNELSGGFHERVETRWPHIANDRHGTLMWVRIPFPIVEGEETTPFQRLAAASDFGNALANYAADWRDPQDRRKASFINTDISVHLLRQPEGEWLCLEADRATHDAGLGLVEVTHYDQHGHFGRSAQARLHNPST